LTLVATCLAQAPPVLSTEEPEVKDATYWLMCSNKVRKGHDFVCSAKILKGSSPVTVTVALRSYDGKKVILESNPTEILPGEFKDIRMSIPFDLENPSEYSWRSSYNLTVQGKGDEVNFESNRLVTRQDKSMAIFVQTDKGIYKFGQTVKFRVLMTSIDLKPMLNLAADIYIEDPKQNRIWQKLGATSTTNSGVIDQFSLQLPDQAPTGTWRIKVEANGMEETVTFDVDDYILPRFEVDVILPPFGLTYNPLLNVTVKATYTFGKPVTNGFVSLILEKKWFYYSGKDFKELRVTGSLNSDGEFTHQFTKKDLIQHINSTTSYRYSQIRLDGQAFKVMANVTENNSMRQQKGKGEITFYDSPLKMDFMDISPSNFKPGLPYTGYVEFKQRDDTDFAPEQLAQMNVHINVTYEVPLPVTTTTTTTTTTRTPTPGEIIPIPVREDIYYPTFNFQPTEVKILSISNPIRTVPDAGWIPISFDIPNDATKVIIEVKGLQAFKNVQTSKVISKTHSPTDSFLQLSVPVGASNPKVGDNIVIEAKSTSPVKELFYQVYAKGLLLMTSSVTPATPSTDLQISLNVDQKMTPNVRVIAFYRREDNSEFVVDALTLTVEGIFQKPVSVSFSKEKVQPGENVDVVVQAEESSVVFLSSNDKSVNLLKKGNDITKDLISEFMFSLDYGGYFPFWRGLMICGGPYYYGGSDASSTFDSANVLIFTDGLVYEHSYFDDIFLPTHMNEGTADKESGGFYAAETVRKFFPENWLWQLILVSTDSNGQVIIPTKAPDTITSWVTTVFSMHPTYGLSVGDEPAELITYRELFVTLDLPLGITQGEDYCFTASVFNYYSKGLEVLLGLDKSDSYNSITLRSKPGNTRSRGYTVVKRSNSVSKMIFVNKDSVHSEMFCINPIAVGDVPVLVKAQTRVAGLSDAVERILKVKPEGVPRTSTNALLVDLSSGSFVQDVPISFPPDAVSGSQRITFSATGSFLGPVVDNLDDLLRMPYGCGEQNMINFAPTVFLTDYYFKTGKIDEEKLEKAKKYMLAGYTKELTYEHGLTGAYSAFGCNDYCRQENTNGSLWLTAFVTKTFAQGEQLNSYQEVFPLDHKILQRSMYWMMRQMNELGEFKEYGKVFNTRMQGGSSKGEALTAYSLIALFEASKIFTNQSSQIWEASSSNIVRGQRYLESQLYQISDAYDACIVGYALHLTGSKLKNEAYDLAERLSTAGDGLKYWKRPELTTEPRYSWSRNNDAISIEATAYCLLMYGERGMNIEASLPVLRWLTNQRGPQGGFISTQDTVIGLQALTSVSAKLFPTQDVPLTIDVSYTDAALQNKKETININQANEMLLQKIYVPYTSNMASVRIEARSDSGYIGATSAMVEVVSDFNVASETQTAKYSTQHRLALTPNGFNLQIRIDPNGPVSMTILRVEIPAGFQPDMKLLEEDTNIRRSEIKDDNLILYYDSAMRSPGWMVSIVMDGPESGNLISSKDKSYTVSNYYQPSEEVTKLYSINDNTKPFCDKVKTFSICSYL